jgi:dolichol kinase
MRPDRSEPEAAEVAATWPAPIAPSGPLEFEGTTSVARPRAADRVFWACLLYIAAIGVTWLFFFITQRDGGLFFRHYNITVETWQHIFGGVTFFLLFWGWLWYRFKRLLLRRVAGFSKEELTKVFESRMDTPFNLQALLANHSERRIRIVDMITRRGRTVPMLMAGWIYFYFHFPTNTGPDALAMGIQDNFFEAIVMSSVTIGFYYSSGFFGRVLYGAHSRVMDGTLGRANVLLIFTMWNVFKFVMIPIGLRLGVLFPPETYAALFVFIWFSYLASDTLSEVVGSLWGKQRLRVWGLGDVNRKSVAGTWACFLGSLIPCALVVIARHLPLPWLGLAVVVSLANTLVELYSPRGTDDFTMATTNALLCWGFGALMY